MKQTYCGTTHAFDKEMSVLSHGDRQKTRHKEELSEGGRRKGRSSSRQWLFHRPSHISKHGVSNGNKKGRASPACSLRQVRESLSSCFSEK